MKPFDLEAAKRGEPLYDPLNGEATFIGLKQNGCVVYEINNWLMSRQPSDLFMAPKKRTVWVVLYRDGYCSPHQFNDERSANTYAIGANSYGFVPAGGKAYPVEIEE